MADIYDGIIIGGAGGAIAGITVYLVQFVHSKVTDCIDKRIVFKWLQGNTDQHKHRTTRAIASHNNMTKDRVRYICSQHKEIKLSTGKKDDVWLLRGESEE